MALRDQIGRLRELRKAINDLAPRDERGELYSKFAKWVAEIDREIEKAERWLTDAKAGKGGTCDQ